MSKMQREKGKAYERAIARVLRAVFPAATVRRSSQADRAANSDVVITGDARLERLWLELQDARAPTPEAKLRQAERDLNELARRATDRIDRLPVVIWHRIRERSHQVTTRLWVVDELRGVSAIGGRAVVVTLDLRAFIELVSRGATTAAATAELGAIGTREPTPGVQNGIGPGLGEMLRTRGVDPQSVIDPRPEAS
jgi:hypothetical protein